MAGGIDACWGAARVGGIGFATTGESVTGLTLGFGTACGGGGFGKITAAEADEDDGAEADASGGAEANASGGAEAEAEADAEAAAGGAGGAGGARGGCAARGKLGLTVENGARPESAGWAA